jgi:uncharacterized protein (DUF1810 family)
MDVFDLERFVTAQAGSYERACLELRSGRKTGHWMWFVFPQLKGLGSSPNANYFGLAGLAEARAYLNHPILGARLEEATRLMLANRGRTARDILGHPDDLKFRSSMTLFAAAAVQGSLFEEALRAYYDGIPDAATLRLLG